MPGRRTSWCVLAGLTALASCTNTPAATPDTSPTETSSSTTSPTAAVEEAEDATPTEPSASSATTPEPECEDRIVLDEYGFPVEFELCDERGDGTVDMTAAGILLRIPSEDSRRALDAAHEAARRLAIDCGDPAAWSTQADRLLDGLRSTIDIVQADSALTDWLGSTDATALADRFRDLLVLPSVCESGEGADDDPASTLATAGLLAGVNDDLRFALADSAQILFDSDFWYATDQIGHLADTALMLESEPIDVLLLGPSTVKRGIDPLQLRESTGRSVYNAAVGALAPDLQLSWYRELRGAGLEPSTVVIGLNTWIEFLECDSPQRDRVDVTDQRRSDAFVGVGALDDVTPGIRLLGGDPPTYEGRALDAHRSTWLPGSGGRIELTDQYQQEIADTQAETYRTLRYDALCSDRLDRITALSEEIAADGSEVVLFVLPTSDAVVGFHPDGREGHTEVLDEYRTIADETGATLVDASDLVDDELYVDLTHVGNPGRALITDALSAALSTSSGSPT